MPGAALVVAGLLSVLLFSLGTLLRTGEKQPSATEAEVTK